MLSRKIGEVIVIGDIKVMVVEIYGDKVKIGIEADRSIPVHRKEVWEKIKEVRKPE